MTTEVRCNTTDFHKLSARPGFPTFLLPCTPSAYRQMSMYTFGILTDVHVPLRYPMTIHFIMIFH